MERYCLDTSAYSNFKRGESQIVDLIRTASALVLPAIVLGELFSGFKLGSRESENRAELKEFLDHPVVSALAVEMDTAMTYSEVYKALKQKGRAIPTNDMWIAAAAIRNGLTLLTFDEHFREIDRLSVIVL